MKRRSQSLLPVFKRDGRSLLYAPDLRINGKTLPEYGADPTDGIVRVGRAEPRTVFTDIPGRTGSLDLSLTDDTGRAYESSRTLEFDLVIVGDGMEALETKRELAGLNGAVVRLDWENLPGYWTGRCSVGAYTDTFLGRRFVHSVATVTITANPWLIGPGEYWEVGTTPVKIWVHGNRPSPPTITMTPPSGTKRLYVTINDYQLVYNLTDADGAKKLVADCDTKTSLWNGNAIFPSVDSDYPILVPGFNSASVTAGTAHIEHTQRIMI